MKICYREGQQLTDTCDSKFFILKLRQAAEGKI